MSILWSGEVNPHQLAGDGIRVMADKAPGVAERVTRLRLMPGATGDDGCAFCLPGALADFVTIDDNAVLILEGVLVEQPLAGGWVLNFSSAVKNKLPKVWPFKLPSSKW